MEENTIAVILFIWKKTRGALGIPLWSGRHNKFQISVRLLVSREVSSITTPTWSFALRGISLMSDTFCWEVNQAPPEHCRSIWSLVRRGRPFISHLLPCQEQQEGTHWLRGVLGPNQHITRHSWWPGWQPGHGHVHQVCALTVSPWWWQLPKKVTEKPNIRKSCETTYLSSFARPSM